MRTFPGGSGIATETLNCFVIDIFHVPLSHVSFLPYLQIMRKKPKPEEPIAQRRTKARHDPKTLEIVEETLRRESSQQRTKGRHDPKPQQLESVHEEKESQEASDGEEDDVSAHNSKWSTCVMVRVLCNKNLATNILLKSSIQPPTFAVVILLLIHLSLKIVLESPLTFSQAHQSVSSRLSQQMSMWLRTQSILGILGLCMVLFSSLLETTPIIMLLFVSNEKKMCIGMSRMKG